MKKLTLTLLCAAFLSNLGLCQTSKAGFPLSMRHPIPSAAIPSSIYAAPNWDKVQQANKEKAAAGISTPYVIGLFVPIDIKFPESGSFSDVADGHKIWRTQIVIPDAPAVGLYYDAFHLPEGVSYYITNEHGNHILGAYTADNNQDNLFANEPIQGHIANLEIDIAPGVKSEAINFHINKALVYYTSINYLAQYAINNDPVKAKPTDADPYNLEGSGSTCNIDATCPLGQGYDIQRKATVQLIIPLDSSGQAGACSGTLINNTGNTTASCKPYILTATHCEGSNYSNSNNISFSHMLVRFNFEKSSCSSTDKATVNTLNGVNLIARSNYTESNSPMINGDFMLLSLKQSIPDSWDAYLSGWNRADSLPLQLTAPQKYIGFHHPAADIKKVSSSQHINPLGFANGSAGVGTHWEMNIENGGVQQGSSGSGLFDADGYHVGIGSVAGNEDNNCGVSGKGTATLFLKTVEYSKLSYDWENTADGNDTFRKLRPWLDPVSTGAITLKPVRSNCEIATTAIHGIETNDLEGSINLYPNPSVTGHITAAMNFAKSTNLKIEVFNVTGSKVASYSVNQVKNQQYAFDLSRLTNGIYLIKFNDGSNAISRKIIIAK